MSIEMIAFDIDTFGTEGYHRPFHASPDCEPVSEHSRLWTL
jgi:hypothetical protein